MDFQKYINHDFTPSMHQSCNIRKIQPKPRVIKFVGNMQENIKQLLQSINCHCGGRKQFFNILLVFANKIEKLRKQREHYKNTLKEYLLTMNSNSFSLRNEQAQKCKTHYGQRKAKTVVKKQQQLSTKYTLTNKQNSTPLKKVADLFMKEKSKTLCINETLIQNLSNKENKQIKNQPTIIKKPVIEESLLLSKTLDKKLSDYYSIKKPQDTRQQILGQEEGSFSLNLSSFEDGDVKKENCEELTKEVSSILNETNLLDSDDDDIQPFKTPCKKSLKEFQLKVEKQKVNNKQTMFQDALFSLNNDQDPITSRKDKTVIKKKQNPQQLATQKKSARKLDNYYDKQNMKAQICLKKYNITIEKLEQFIENKQCLRQIERGQSFDTNLKNFKSVSMSVFNKQPVNSDYGYGSIMKTVRPAKPLQERRFNFNC